MNKIATSDTVGRKYLPTIGLEIHAELKTASKMFCNCKNDPDEDKPNVNVCPICLGHPGALPVLNKEAVAKVLQIGIAVNGRPADFTEWDRKQYFYPDIPKGYQISQYAYPLVSGGMLAGVELERVHLEEDTAQSTHDTHEKSLINFNRSGVPLMELVTKPAIHDARTAVRFAQELQLLLRCLGAGEANMEKGEMRVEANISVASAATVEAATSVDFRGAERNETKTLRRAEEGAVLGTKTEVKNLNSFRAVERAIEFEIKRQTGLLERGEKVTQETRGWDDRKNETYSQRSKENAHDYRYFPEPDIPKLKISEIPEFNRVALSKAMPELPWTARERFKREYGATDKEAEMFVENVKLAEYFGEIIKAGDKLKTNKKEYARLAMNYLLTDYLGTLNKKSGEEKGCESIPSINIKSVPPSSWTDLISMIMKGELSSRGAKNLLVHLIDEPNEQPRQLAKKHDLLQENDPNALSEIIKKILDANTAVVNEYKAGKSASLQYLIGQVMKTTKGSANPGLIKEILLKLLR